MKKRSTTLLCLAAGALLLPLRPASARSAPPAPAAVAAVPLEGEGGPRRPDGPGPGGPGGREGGHDVDWAEKIAKLDPSKLPAASDRKGLTFAKDVRPLFQASCARCHGGERAKGGLRLDTLDAALKGGDGGKAVVPGKSAQSFVVLAASQIDPETAMPPKRGPGGGRGGPGGPGGGPGGPDGGRRGPGGPGGQGGPGGRGQPAQPLTAEQVGLVRAWIDQGAK